MKKLILITAILLTVNIGHSQVFTIFGKDIGFLYVGPKFGMGTSFISNYTQGEQKTRLFLNVVGGVVGEFGITERLSIQPEILFSRKGGKSFFEYNDPNDAAFDYKSINKTIANYIGIPILAKYSFLKIKDFKIHGSGGFYTNIATGQKFKSVTEYSDDTFEYEEDIPKNFYKKVDFGLSIGAGAEYDLGFGLLVGELLIDHGFVDNYENDLIDKSNRHTSVTVAFTFLYDVVKLINK